MNLSFERQKSLDGTLPDGAPAPGDEAPRFDTYRGYQTSFLVVGAHADLLIGRAQGYFTWGLRAGYLYTPDYGTWETRDDGAPVGDLPDFGIRGAYLSLVFGAGKF
jgi:hypothetical protein